jgi:hypothetical protein
LREDVLPKAASKMRFTVKRIKADIIFSLLNVEGGRSQHGTEVIATVLILTDQAKSAGSHSLFFSSPCQGKEKAFVELLITTERACFSTHGVAGSAL